MTQDRDNTRKSRCSILRAKAGGQLVTKVLIFLSVSALVVCLALWAAVSPLPTQSGRHAALGLSFLLLLGLVGSLFAWRRGVCAVVRRMLLIELTLAAALAAVVTVRVPVTSLTLVPAGKPRRQHPYGTYFTSYGDIRKHYMRLKVTRLQPDTPGDWLFSFGQSGRRIFTLDAFVFGIGRYDQPYPGKGEDEWMTSEHAFVWGKSWFVTLTLALYPTWVLMRIMIDRTRRHRRREVGLCTKCGYNLTGNVSGRCPECGKEPVAADSVE